MVLFSVESFLSAFLANHLKSNGADQANAMKPSGRSREILKGDS